MRGFPSLSLRSIFALGFVYIHDFAYQGWIIAGGILGIIVLFDIMPGIFLWKKYGSFEQALEESLKSWRPSHSLLGMIRRRFGQRVVSAILYCSFAIVLADAMGSSAATKQTRFLVPKSDPGLIVARIYGDRAIAVPFEGSSKSPKKSIRILPFGSKGTADFEWVETGRLNFKD